MFELISTKEAPSAIGPYSQGYVHNGMLFASGQIGIDPATGNVGATIEEQAEQSCKNVGALLRAAGMGYENVIRTTCYLADMNDFVKFNEIYAKYFTSKPARSCVAVKDIPKGAKCEIEITALK